MTKLCETAELQKIRDKIDSIDQQIQSLLSERATYAQTVAAIKRDAGATTDFYRPDREAQVIRKVMERNKGPLPDDNIAFIFREIMSACLQLQQPVKIAFLGPEGTFTHAAANKQFGHGMITVPLPTPEAVFREVESGAATYGVLPVENSTEGAVSHTLDCIMSSPLNITGEIEIKINQNLISKAESFADIKKIYSHQQALAQTRSWLDANIPNAERLPVSSTAEAVKLAANDGSAAAISGISAAEIYHVPVLAERIEDDPCNTTRFLVIGKNRLPPSGNDKTSLLLSNKNIPGGLFKLLEPLADYQVDMTKIESRPSRQGTWDYVFFVDVLGHCEDEELKAALNRVERKSSLFKVLGSYPRAAL